MASLDLGVRIAATSSGAGDFVSFGPVTGYRDLSASMNGKTYRYRAESPDLTQWEYGSGQVSGGNTIARASVKYSSTGAKVNFAVAPQVAISIDPDDVLQFDDAMSLTAAQQARGRSNLNAAPFDALAASGLQVNGAMEVSQENGAAARTTSGYVVDGWQILSTGTMGFSAAQVADAPSGFTNSIKVAITTAAAALGSGDYLIIAQPIEGFRTSRLGFGMAAAQPISIGFWTKVHRAGTYSGSVRNSASTRSYSFTFTQDVADAWEYKTVTLPGDTSGAWTGNTNGVGLWLSFAIACGTTFAGAAGAWASANYLAATGTTNGAGTLGDVFQITGVVVLPGTEVPAAARSALAMRSYDVELRLCERYLQFATTTTIGVYLNGAGQTLYLSKSLLTEMRAGPTASQFTAPSYSNCSVTIGGTTVRDLRLDLTATAAGATYAIGGVYKLDARL
ncbi:hypothetical protein [Bradyrhizobium sp. WD16]|uniref:hypothetical protein n=1 Tax=Bradyrhizobium sp. WD16 TaxID=1521768 RepID=UPI0020A3F3D9|nr:hypothetical protein [Bradyrhizobium sp. WD16]UTD28230.1 hypothetical protein DB459_16345 [Bradyrhizobium sp. WD16]